MECRGPPVGTGAVRSTEPAVGAPARPFPRVCSKCRGGGLPPFPGAVAGSPRSQSPPPVAECVCQPAPAPSAAWRGDPGGLSPLGAPRGLPGPSAGREPSCWGAAVRSGRSGYELAGSRLPARGFRDPAPTSSSPSPFPLAPGFTVESVVSLRPPSPVPAPRIPAVRGAGLSLLPQSRCGAGAAPGHPPPLPPARLESDKLPGHGVKRRRAP